MFKRAWVMLSAGLVSLSLWAGPAPSFTLKGLDGSTFRLADHVGKQVIVLDFWATWCGPCTKFLKKLQEIKEQRPDVLVLAISIDDGQSLDKVNQYVRGRGFTFMVLSDPDSSVLRMFNPSAGVPTTVVIDRNGNVAYQHTGALPGDEKSLATKLDELRR
ncbi:MAG: TlpA family protein disulfide reductase [Firmicutes bacterium]|nr:TlpA family protein disulfide reductase [Bacillota bacterium]